MSEVFIPGYHLRQGSRLDRALLLKFVYRTYKEQFPEQELSHLASTVEQYFSPQTPLWWVDEFDPDRSPAGQVACLWLGNAIDLTDGERTAHVFLLYVAPEHRKRGIGSALMVHAQQWATGRGDRKISLQVFTHNQPALNLYQKLGYQPQSLLMQKILW
ncbi:GNAT family N-acetyltransferase [Planktothrix paucivesiculata]|uniref:GCN5-related N-acetyltransferase n=1 Tax=Planktothrix paucivesiculata PCC 9631 TaxID=671071 RepID=A0A7Z9BTA7_9CYAN|nr:GNAT family N-acetyltransferase [Planktothrix paucivesiculata]VXD21891.1 GCN5-related N-acetyltransferase [Planktothrix paucivesiculata PCC 9631]